MPPRHPAQILRSAAVGGLGLGAAVASTLGVATSSAGAETVAAAAYGPTTASCDITVTASTVQLGAPLTVAGDCGVAGDPLQLTIGGTSLGHYTAAAGGTYHVTATVPSAVGIGRQTIRATNVTHHATASTDIMVLQAGQLVATDPSSAAGRAATTHGSLAFTGTNVGTMTAVGAAAVGLGGIVVLASRRRRQHRWSQ